MERDLRFAWEEMPQQLLDEQAQKVRESLHATLIEWARQAGEGGDYTGQPAARSACTRWGTGTRSPTCCATARWLRLLAEYPRLNYLMVHNIDTVGADRGRGPAGLPHRRGRGADHRSDCAPPRRSRRRPGARQWPSAAGGGNGAAARRDRIPAFVLQQRHVLARYRPRAGGVRPGARRSGRPGETRRRPPAVWPRECPRTSP